MLLFIIWLGVIPNLTVAAVPDVVAAIMRHIFHVVYHVQTVPHKVLIWLWVAFLFVTSVEVYSVEVLRTVLATTIEVSLHLLTVHRLLGRVHVHVLSLGGLSVTSKVAFEAIFQRHSVFMTATGVLLGCGREGLSFVKLLLLTHMVLLCKHTQVTFVCLLLLKSLCSKILVYFNLFISSAVLLSAFKRAIFHFTRSVTHFTGLIL